MSRVSNFPGHYIYTFGDAPFDGAPGNTGAPVVSALRTPDGGGYWILDAAGHVHGYGDAAHLGDDTGSGTASAIFTDVPATATAWSRGMDR